MYRLNTLSVALLACLTLSACQVEEKKPLVNKGEPIIDTPIETPDISEPPSDGGDEPVQVPAPPPTTFSVTISWDIPDERVNGEDLMLSEIGGYEIAYKRTTDEAYSIMVVSDQTKQEHELLDLPAGHYEFLIAAFDSMGIYSDYSDPTFADIGI